MVRKRPRVEMADVSSRAGSETLGGFKPKTCQIGTIDDLLAAEVPDWSTEPADQYEFFEYLRRTELVLNTVITAMSNTPRVSTVLCFSKHTDGLEHVHEELFRTYLQNYRDLRPIQKVGDTTGTSAAMVTTLVLSKLYYLVRVLKALQRAIAEKKLRSKARVGFSAPFIPLKRMTLEDLQRPPSSRMVFGNGDVKIPKPYNFVPRVEFPTLYDMMVLVYPDLRIGEFSQFNLFQQVLRLADQWHSLNLSCPELKKFIWSIYARYTELVSISYDDDAQELDMAEHYRRSEALKGRDKQSIRTNKQLKILSDSASIEDSQLTVEQKRMKKANLDRYSVAARFQIELMGMLTYMLADIDVMDRLIAPNLSVLKDSRPRFAVNVMASLLRYSGGTSLLRQIEPDDDRAMEVPMPYETETTDQPGPQVPEGTSSPMTAALQRDYLVVYHSLLEVLQKKQQDVIDDSSKRKLYERIRHAILPLGIRERYCLMNNLIWSENPLDHETVVIVRTKLNFQMRYWESYPSSYFLSYDQPIPCRLLFTAYVVNSLASHDRQKRNWSSDGLVCSSTLDIGQLESTIATRKIPFILQFGKNLYLADAGRFYECANIPEAVLAWLSLCYGILNGNFCLRSGTSYRAEYLDQLIYDVFEKLPQSLLLKISEFITARVREMAKAAADQDDTHIAVPEESSSSDDDGHDSTDDERYDEDYVYGLGVLFR